MFFARSTHNVRKRAEGMVCALQVSDIIGTPMLIILTTRVAFQSACGIALVSASILPKPFR